MKRWRIQLDGKGHGLIEVDGRELAVKSIRITAAARQRPIIEIEVFPHEVDLYLDDPKVTKKATTKAKGVAQTQRTKTRRP